MKIADCDILIVPGLGSAGPDHWQARWAGRLATGRVVDLDGVQAPTPEAWAGRIAAAVAEAARPAVLIAHGLGVLACVAAAPRLPPGAVRGALLVAPTDAEEAPDLPEAARAFAPIPRDPLPFPALVVASRTDPHCTYARAEDMAHAWGAVTVDAGESGRIDAASGHGPWPEGLMRLAGFLKGL